MKQCKYCQAELAENGTFCPVCGMNNAEADAVEETAAVEETTTLEETAAVEEITTLEETVPAGEAPAQKGKATPGKIAIAVVAVVVLAAMLIGLLAGGMNTQKAPAETLEENSASAETSGETVPPATIPADGNPDDETCKGTYTASDQDVIANADTVVATMGEYQLTNGELQVYYWLEVQAFMNNYGMYAYYYGLDYTQPLDMQVCYLSDKQGSWQQFFLASALQTWQNYQAMYCEAEANDFQLSEEDLAYLAKAEQNLSEQAAENGFDSSEAFLAYNVGAGADLADYFHFNEIYYKGYQYYTQLCDAIELTDQEIEDYYTANEAAFTEQGVTKDAKYVDVRHILIMPEGGTTDENGVTTYSDEEWAAAQQKAQEILDLYLAGDKTEASFGELANAHTQDGNDANMDGQPDGGLYTGVVKGQMVEPFENWCFDEGRIIGDTGLVQTTYGWHVMYFAGSEPIWITKSESALLGERITAMIEEINAKHPGEVDYSSILLGYVNMGA